MRANFEDSYRALDPAAARLFRLLGVHPGDAAGPADAAVLADLPEPEARRLLTVLAAAGLAAESPDGRFRLPGALRARARERAEREETRAARDAALRRVLDRVLADAGEEFAAEGLALLDRERWSEAAETLEERLRDLEDGGEPERDGGRHDVMAVRLDLARAVMLAGDLDRAIGLLGLLPDGFAALPEPDQDGRARALATLGEAHLRAHRPVAAINFFGQALELMRRADAVDRQAGLFVNLAEAARMRGDDAAESAALDRAVDLYEAVSAQGAATMEPGTGR